MRRRTGDEEGEDGEGHSEKKRGRAELGPQLASVVVELMLAELVSRIGVFSGIHLGLCLKLGAAPSRARGGRSLAGQFAEIAGRRDLLHLLQCQLSQATQYIICRWLLHLRREPYFAQRAPTELTRRPLQLFHLHVK